MMIDQNRDSILKITYFAILVLGSACAHDPAPKASSSAVEQTASAPNSEKTRKHLQEHVSYPASRAQILEACAHTPEFTQSEKQWFSERLPDRTYASADEVLQALQL